MIPSSVLSLAASGILGIGQFLAGPLELPGTGVGVGFAVGLGDADGGELDAVEAAVGDAPVDSTGSALPLQPAAVSTSTPEQKTSMTFLNFANMPAAYDSVGVN
ncbi:hypothetical protein DQ353_09850 [Arthrobacter sp. AQ5-05]|nr:hypothetical protein DQ353_09850 [Arthrobacter sp. AQ5-05]